MEIIRDSVRIARDACRDYWQSIGGESNEIFNQINSNS